MTAIRESFEAHVCGKGGGSILGSGDRLSHVRDSDLVCLQVHTEHIGGREDKAEAVELSGEFILREQPKAVPMGGAWWYRIFTCR